MGLGGEVGPGAMGPGGPGRGMGMGMGPGVGIGPGVGAGTAGVKRKRAGGLVTITEIKEDELMAVANANWARGSKAASKGTFKANLVSCLLVYFSLYCLPLYLMPTIYEL